MLKTLKQLFDAVVPPSAADHAQDEQHAVQLATAVLLVEVMRADPELVEAERHAIIVALRDQFGLQDDEIDRLIELAEQTAQRAPDFFGFTSRINEAFSMEQKIRMIEQMWRVAYASGTLEAHENHLMRKVASLLYIPHGAYVHAKMRAKGAGGEG